MRYLSFLNSVHRKLVICVAAVLLLILWSFLDVKSFVLLQSIAVASAVVLLWNCQSQLSAPTDSALLEIPFRLAHDPEMFARYQRFTTALQQIGQCPDTIYRELSLEVLDDTIRRIDTLADGVLNFEGTETWRIVYERLLRSPGLHRYRSVAWVQSAGYWQDEPGRKSMAVNFELQRSGRATIERIAIVADHLWPEQELWPVESLRQWIHEQHAEGIRVSFVRESVVAAEPDLLADIGIYGSRAVGTQELDEHARTIRFHLEFGINAVAAAEDRWNRLAVYSETFAGYLDRYEMDR